MTSLKVVGHAAVLALVTLTCTAVQAASSDNDGTQRTYANSPHAYMAIMPGYLYVDKGHGGTGSPSDPLATVTRNGFTMSGIFGWQFAPQWEVEVNLFGSMINADSSNSVTDFYQDGLSLDLAYNLFGTDRTGFTPFIIAGVGGVFDDVSPNSYESLNFQANGGLGFVTGPLMTKGLLAGLKVRAEARYLYDRNTMRSSSGLNDARASIGFEIPLGVPPPPPPPPPKVKVVEKIVKVPTPAPPPKVIRCPIPFPGAKLDENGCAIAPQTVVLHGVHFAFNKYSLRPDAETLLNQVATAMDEQKGMTVQIAGHTDSIGPASYNQKLSKERADSVRAYLIRKGIAAGRMTTIGYGESQPLVSPERNADDRAKNRRVEFHILTQ